jgi:diguanylate cyclase (GGDEF)-like protein
MPVIQGAIPSLRRVTRPEGVRSPDVRARQLGLLIRMIGLAILPVDALEVGVGIAFNEPRAMILGLASLTFAIWVLHLSRRPERIGLESTITRLAAATLSLIAVAAILEPAVSTAMAIAALLPAVLVLPFLGNQAVRRVLVAALVVGIGSVVSGLIVPRSDRLPAEATGSLAFVTLLLAYGFLMLFLWEVSRRMKATAEDLRSVVAMSKDLSHTMDPQLVGDRIARHIAQVVGASEAAICYWDRPTDRLLTMGCYPPERVAALLPWYPLVDFPATRVVLDTTVPAIVDAADPDADASEVAYLATIGMRSMAMVPLMAAGTPIGTLELMSERSGVFGVRDVQMATMLAGEGAMALENARLYEEIRHQALHDGLTGLANRVLFRDRVANALERNRGRDGQPFAILFIDLDDFKVLNDTLGHARGDDILVAVARRVAESLRPADTAARLGGDEFAVLLDGIGTEERAMSIAIRLADTLREPMEVGDVVTTVDGLDVAGASYSNGWTLMQAPPGTKLQLGLARGTTVAITLAAP